MRVKLTLWYAVVLFSSLLLCGELLYQEWVVEPQEKATRHEKTKRHEIESDSPMGDLFESVLWSAVPAAILGLGGGWLLMRKAMAPVTALTRAVEQMNESNLNIQLARSGAGDELDRLTAVFNDMAARLADSFRRIREFTLRASHELKTPLTVMRGSMETALSGPEMNAEQRERLHDELDEVDRLTKIVNGLTLMTKADAGLITLKREKVSLDALVREIFSDGLMLARPLDVAVHLDVCVESIIQGDNNRLRQMLLNLVDNALKYNHPGGTVHLALARFDSAAEVTISNTGPGIPSEIVPRLFEPFYRGDESHAREVDGCGLGLSIVHWIVTSHGGTVNISSEPGGFTTVKVLLPLDAVSSQRDRPTHANAFTT